MRARDRRSSNPTRAPRPAASSNDATATASSGLASAAAIEIAVASATHSFAPSASTTEWATMAAGDDVEIHGGRGFTWEADAHLYFERAKSSSLLFGDPVKHREKLAARIGR